MDNKRTIPTWLLDKARLVVEKVNKRADKLGVQGMELIVSEPRMIKKGGLGFGSPIFEEVVDISIVGPSVVMPGGWSLEGKIDFEEGQVMVSGRPGGAAIPASYRSASPGCDHCKVNRKRSAVLLFNNPSGAWIQVGRSCVVDFFGVSPESALWAASVFVSVMGEIDDAYAGGGGRIEHSFYLPRLIAITLRVAAHSKGFVSRAAAEKWNENPDRVTMVPTSSRVIDYMIGTCKASDEYRKEVGSLTDEDEKLANEVIAWGRGRYLEESASDYEHNMALILSREYISMKRLGLAVSVVSGYLREMEKAEAAKRIVQGHVGSVGERRNFSATFLGESSYESQFGLVVIGRFATSEGVVVYKGCSPFWNSMKSGAPIEFHGTVKEHGEYAGKPQTMVSRCVMGLMPEKKAKRAKACMAS